MDYQKALKILDLKPNFTEDEFKKTYRQLSHKYHPDKWEGTDFYDEAIRKQQEINEAREYLRNYLKNHPYNNPHQNKQFDVNQYAKEKLASLNSKTKVDGAPISDEDFKNILNKIKNEIYSFETDAFNFFTTTKEKVDRLYATCVISIRMILENFVASFYQKHYIDKSEVKETIDYDCNLVDFYNQLLKIKEQYSKIVKNEKRLDAETEQYKGYAGYEKLAKLIDLCKKNALYYIKQNNFQNIEEEIEKMHQQIKEDVFKTYYSIKQKLSELEKIVNNITDETIKNEYLNISNHFENGASFYDTEESIKKLEELIHKYQEIELKKQKQKEINDTINQIYQSLITRYSETIKQYNIVNQSEEIKKLNELLKQILQLFTKGCEEFKDLEFFTSFNDITFTNVTNDDKTIQNIIQKLKTNKSNIYLKLTNNYMFDDTSFFYLDEENMVMYKYSYNDIFSRKITKEELTTEYVPIEEFFKSATFIGEYKIRYARVVKYLYENDKIAIYYINGKFNVSPKTNLDNPQTMKPADASFEPFKDKQYVSEMIEKQVKSAVEEYIKKQSQNSTSYSPNPNIYGEPPFNYTNNASYDEPDKRRREIFK